MHVDEGVVGGFVSHGVEKIAPAYDDQAEQRQRPEAEQQDTAVPAERPFGGFDIRC
jgi:hypothetical protein